MRAGTVLALLSALMLATGAAQATPDGDPDWHIPLAPDLSAEPTQPAAQRLQAALARYRQLATDGGWPNLPETLTPQPGQRDAGVVALRDRLRIEGDYTGLPGTADAWFFDGSLVRAIEGFQNRHGLPATGVPDARTLTELNVPVADRIRQLETTLIRWRWLPRDFGPRYLWVNVPGGSLDLVEDGTTTLTMRVIAGHPDRPTPSFEDTVTAVVVNPPWSVPRTIAVEDLLPTQQEDPT
ncbi:MAG: peptidoglycan-binding protein, partial [Gammaproteobacteria bacterium]